MRFFLIVVLASVLCVCVAAQNPTSGQYDDEDAYEIYSLLLPGEQSYGIAKGTLVIQQETDAYLKLDDDCLTSQAGREFRDAIEDYKRHNEPMMLQRKFKIDKSYELVSTETIGTLIKDHDWGSFYKQSPDSGGIIRMSAVGFNRQETLAIVDTGSSCNNQCGRGSLHLFKKIDGKWKPVPGVRCFLTS
jgi:hypothetical protein